MNIHNLRHEYSNIPLKKNTAPKDPLSFFHQWFSEAKESELLEINAMVLATATKKGRPSTRTVLLKKFNEEGFDFYSNYNSQKAQELLENPWASATFLWLPLQRQVHIFGMVEKLTRKESELYFSKRPRGSQISAWASNQSKPVENRDKLQKEYQKIDNLFPKKIPCPENWGGYKIKVEEFEFWQGRKNRLHDRLRYTKSSNGWECERLSP